VQVEMKLRITLLVLASVLMAAHFLRSFAILPMLICLAAPFLLLVKKRWSLFTLQALTVVAAVIWLMTLNGIIQERVLEGRSWTASAIILGVVAGYTLLTGWLLNNPVVKEKYP
jgi:hypothetical protein